MVGLVFLWLTNVALLLGAEIDSELERGRQLQAGIAAETEIQLPARDTRNIEKAAKKEAGGRRQGAAHPAGRGQAPSYRLTTPRHRPSS